MFLSSPGPNILGVQPYSLSSIKGRGFIPESIFDLCLLPPLSAQACEHTHTSSYALVKLENGQNCFALSPAPEVQCGGLDNDLSLPHLGLVPLGALGLGGREGAGKKTPGGSLDPGQLWPVDRLY